MQWAEGQQLTVVDVCVGDVMAPPHDVSSAGPQEPRELPPASARRKSQVTSRKSQVTTRHQSTFEGTGCDVSRAKAARSLPVFSVPLPEQPEHRALACSRRGL